jgi:flagellar hook-length control protein FliK
MTVNNVGAMPAFASGRVDAAGSVADESLKGSFEQVMTKLNGKTDGLQTGVSGSNTPAVQTVVPPVNTVQKDLSVGKTGVQDTARPGNTVQKDSDGNITQDARADGGSGSSETVSEKLEKSGEELIQDIAEEMDVTPEEVEEAMEILGLAAVQLFDTDNLKQLLLVLSGSEDELSLLTDGALYDSLQDLSAVVAENLEGLQEELGLSNEEMEALMKQIMSGQDDTAMPEETLAPEETTLEGMKDYTVSVQKDGETVQVKVTVDDVDGDKSVQESVTGTSRNEMQSGQKMQERDASANSGREGNEAGHALLQAPETPAVLEAPEPVQAEYRSLQTEEIMNQIMDYMKINLKADTQTMELQLHPASLGTLNVQIMAREGSVTAHFTTQNEAVRAVIETQLIQLKNQFEEQGIKVDAVEVTVANHAYGQQLSQDNGNARQDQAKSGKGQRRINLDQIDGEEDLEEMEDSERIAVEMMQASGNTVDYTA